jgi:hypothetical protein
MQELLLRAEELDPELEPYVTKGAIGEMVHHPLIIEIFYRPGYCALLNAHYHAIKKQAQEYLEADNFQGYIFRHEKPYRISAFNRCLTRGLKGQQYWECLASVWTSSENIWQHHKTWKELWNSKEPSKLACMDPAEQMTFHNLPPSFTVWRGVQYRGRKKGLSWTLDKNRAEWFAKRYLKKGRTPWLCSATVLKSYVHAYLNGRNEQEIIADRVTLLNMEELK